MSATTCPVQHYLDYVSNEDHVWNDEKYITSRQLQGTSFDHETSLTMQYCRGASFARGMIGNTKIKIYGSTLQGFQVNMLFDNGFKAEKGFAPHQIEEIKRYIAAYDHSESTVV